VRYAAATGQSPTNAQLPQALQDDTAEKAGASIAGRRDASGTSGDCSGSCVTRSGEHSERRLPLPGLSHLVSELGGMETL
jgi:hypothetical protein